MFVRSVDPDIVDPFTGRQMPPLRCLVAEESGEVIARIGVDTAPKVFATAVDELLRTANLAARVRGLRAMLSDVDVLNAPMAAAMQRAGHRPGVRPWHLWHHRIVATGD